MFTLTNMIGQLNGRVITRTDKWIIVDVNDTGYRLTVSTETIKHLPPGPETKVRLHTYLVVRDDALELFGFWNETEQKFFELLITLPGIGPKSAIAILSVASPELLRRAIHTGQAEYLTKMSGIGKKNAEKIVLNLKDKLDGVVMSDEPGLNKETEVVEILQALGYSLAEGRQALQQAPAEKYPDTHSRLKAALKFLGK